MEEREGESEERGGREVGERRGKGAGEGGRETGERFLKFSKDWSDFLRRDSLLTDSRRANGSVLQKKAHNMRHVTHEWAMSYI